MNCLDALKRILESVKKRFAFPKRVRNQLCLSAKLTRSQIPDRRSKSAVPVSETDTMIVSEEGATRSSRVPTSSARQLSLVIKLTCSQVPCLSAKLTR
ncbi:hypothetical protein NDU88_001810 [Pleurodeles waltl]|uniref:Uncharacterized protein n=1 Tax=Pleurodeles waltl TaxID=8319 RepID=A0AAV7VXG8_PLEWA|nr:hypothetical protein NDU88_001810 [Pleurodeles waltl]